MQPDEFSKELMQLLESEPKENQLDLPLLILMQKINTQYVNRAESMTKELNKQHLAQCWKIFLLYQCKYHSMPPSLEAQNSLAKIYDCLSDEKEAINLSIFSKDQVITSYLRDSSFAGKVIAEIEKMNEYLRPLTPKQTKPASPNEWQEPAGTSSQKQEISEKQTTPFSSTKNQNHKQDQMVAFEQHPNNSHPPTKTSSQGDSFSDLSARDDSDPSPQEEDQFYKKLKLAYIALILGGIACCLTGVLAPLGAALIIAGASLTFCGGSGLWLNSYTARAQSKEKTRSPDEQSSSWLPNLFGQKKSTDTPVANLGNNHPEIP